jgi:hypothetical protein
MKAHPSLFALIAAAALVASPVNAQAPDSGTSTSNGTSETKSAAPAETTATIATLVPQITMQYYKPQDQRALNQFETPKVAGANFDGFKLSWGAAFTQQFQGLSHQNTAAERLVDDVDANELKSIGNGFNNATANLYLNAQLAPGIRVALTSYLSSRHHNETWVKDGYLLIDESPLEVPALQSLMEVVTLKLGHFEINYGDAHFRRSDNGNAMQNPFVGNLIMDAFTTEVGGEVYLRKNGFMAMGAITGGEIRGNVQNPDGRAPSYIAKVGFDRQVRDDVRLRLTGSMYTTSKSISNTLYGGDRAGSRYYLVMENTTATESVNASSGLINPGLRSKVQAFQINPFVKVGDLELFGVIEQAEGRVATESADRQWNQYAAEAVYRFLPGDKIYVGARYNTVEGRMSGMANDVGADRTQFSAGWFVTPLVLLKAEYVTQKYNDFPTTDIRNGGKFDGLVFEGVVAF